MCIFSRKRTNSKIIPYSICYYCNDKCIKPYVFKCGHNYCKNCYINIFHLLNINYDICYHCSK